MIGKIQALRYRCLRYVDQRVDPFQLLVGANATGKTTFLDGVSLLGDIVTKGVETAVRDRSNNPQDLLWMKKGDSFELALEVAIPSGLIGRIEEPDLSHVRYEVAVGLDVVGEGIGLLTERVWLICPNQEPEAQRDFFPLLRPEPDTIMLPKRKAKNRQRLVVSKVIDGNDNYMAETAKGYNPSYRQSPKKSALANLPADEVSFPVSTWLKTFLTEGVQTFVLNSQLIRKASPPKQGKGFKTDGSNLPWVVEELKQANEPRFCDWVRHLRTALPDLQDIRTVEREDDKHRYLMLKYDNGLEIPSWMASDGTLRLLALTLPAYLPEFKGLYLIEEPENGIHPKAAETVFQSLSSVYDAQVLMATHSPVLLSLIKPKDAAKVLCFAKAEDGSTDIIAGDKHPGLRTWQGDPNLYVLFAGGVLG
ncbi:MAG: ATP-binding protein [Lentisphaerae bacterium]|nr:ATP-binding protein [Lentisphaerota bacterium]